MTQNKQFKNSEQTPPKKEEKIEENSSQERRGQVVLDRTLQMYHFSSIAICVFIMVGLFFSILLLGGHRNLMQDWVALTALMIMFAMGPIFGIHSILHSHRIVGPVYHVQKGLNEVTYGNYKNLVKLREKDYFQDLAHKFNEMTKELQEKEKNLLDIKNNLKNLEVFLSKDKREEYENHLKKMENIF